MKCYFPTHQLITSPLVFHCSQFHFSSNFNLSLWPEGNNVSGIIFCHCNSRGITLSLCLSISTVSFYMIIVAGFLLCVKNIKTQRYHLTVEQFKQIMCSVNNLIDLHFSLHTYNDIMKNCLIYTKDEKDK